MQVVLMSLHARLVGLICIALAASLTFGLAIACLSASRSVQTEMRSALAVAQQTIENGLDGLKNSQDPFGDLESLIAPFRGNRHLTIFVTGDDGAIVVPVPEAPALGDIPAWFVDLIGVTPTSVHLPIRLADDRYRTVVLQTNPHNEILEVWDQFSNSLIVLALFCLQGVLLIPWLVRRALRPLDRLAAALQRVGHGDYNARVEERIALELSPLAASFNRMARQLADMDEKNRCLNEQLLTLQEQERVAIARDLHDEVGPFLFAVNVDAASIERLASEDRTAEILKHVRSIRDAVAHMQRQVKGILGRLQPSGLAEFGLPAAIHGLVDFWRRRHPDIDYRIALAPGPPSFGELADVTIYRVVQEGLNNAVRHGRPHSITVAVSCRDGEPDRPDEITIAITDDGAGMKEGAGFGFGLLGMRERLKAMGGVLECIDRPEGGLAIRACLPCRLTRAAADVPEPVPP